MLVQLQCSVRTAAPGLRTQHLVPDQNGESHLLWDVWCCRRASRRSVWALFSSSFETRNHHAFLWCALYLDCGIGNIWTELCRTSSCTVQSRVVLQSALQECVWISGHTDQEVENILNVRHRRREMSLQVAVSIDALHFRQTHNASEEICWWHQLQTHLLWVFYTLSCICHVSVRDLVCHHWSRH